MKKKLILVFMLFWGMCLFGEDWLDLLVQEYIQESTVDTSGLTLDFNYLPGTFWIDENPFSENANSEILPNDPLVFSDGFVFLGNERVLLVKVAWSALNLKQYNSDYNNYLGVYIASIIEISKYEIDENSGILSFYGRKLSMKDNKLYVTDERLGGENKKTKIYVLTETFPLDLADQNEKYYLWGNYRRRIN